MSIATLLINATVDAVRETDRIMLDAMQRSVPLFDAAAAQQWYDQRDYDAMRRSLMEQVPASLRPTFKPLPAEESTDIYFPLTTATGTYRATGTITINKDLAQGLLKAVETPMLKVGDRVKILRAMTAEEKDKTPHGWMSGMQQFVGTVGVVSGMNSYGAQVKHTSGIIYSWPLSFLELVPAAAPSVDESFGPFPSKEEAEAVNQDDADAGNDGLPLWEVKAPSGELSLVTVAAPSPSITMYVNGKATTFPTTATAAPSPSIKVTDVAMTTTVQQPSTATAAELAAKPRSTDARAAERLALAASTPSQEAEWRGFPTMEEVREEPFTVWAFQRPDSFVFYGYFVIAVTNPGQQYIYLQRCSDKGVFQFGAVGPPFTELQELKARRAIECPTDTKCGAYVSTVEQGLGEVVGTRRRRFTEPGDVNRDSMGAPICDVRFGDKTVAVPLRDLTFEYKNFAAKIAATVERKAVEAEARQRDPLIQDVKLSCKAIPAKEGFAASQIHHEGAYARGTSDCPLGEVLTRTPTTTGERWVVSALPPDTDADEAADALVAAMKHAMSEDYRTNPLTSATTSATIPKQLGATMPTTEVKSTSRMRRAITEATRRAPVELGLNQAHEAIVKQAAKKFKGTAAEKKVVARFLTDLLGSEYGKAGLAAALATVIPQLAPLLGKHEGKADVLAEELATRSATILAVKAGADLISLLGPLTAILSDMISSAEPPQITAGGGKSALDEISVTAADVAATAKR